MEDTNNDADTTPAVAPHSYHDKPKQSMRVYGFGSKHVTVEQLSARLEKKKGFKIRSRMRISNNGS